MAKSIGGCSKCVKVPAVIGNSRCIPCILRAAALNYLGSRSRWKELETLFEHQQGRCAVTGLTIGIGIDAELDHVIPRANGGDNRIENLRWTAGFVNRMKFDMTDDEFASAIEVVYNAIKDRRCKSAA